MRIGAHVARRQRLADAGFRVATQSFAVLVLILLGGAIVSLTVGALPALQAFGPGFFLDPTWQPPKEIFGGLAPIYGTLVTSVIAMIIAVPVSFGIAIELLAGIPSIIYGIWGFLVLGPVLQQTILPFLKATLGQLPGIGFLFSGVIYGQGIFTAGIVLAIMILPFITAITRDVFETVPPLLKESAYGLGATTWEVMWKVVLPYSRAGVVGGVMLGLGRALGETMAVAFVVGSAIKINASLLAPGTTISATIANLANSNPSELLNSALLALGLALFVITFIVLSLAKLQLMRLQRKAGG
ncbi:phosphate ABC transporter permease subunit PstC [Inquilinus limosus]|uniref:Phosphate transport system permease protein n=1 Tax=Inquilinus limosus MP06 TaxID=1398085 RepID=A0A0A0D1E0_9PROT|nr:phosphate ABC transporter permease subunit PstC [Inquilinus limosus]KGM32551.1 phosphate ABC transporter permease [Inquilinus limosus MP06]